ncbi:MAG: sigma-70 family RNA polymerase sigma factor [Phycisphaeraceae bacterium]
MERDETFVQELLNSQTRLHAFILSLLADRAAADDVLQETNMVLWRKAEEFKAGTRFTAWAMKVAHFQVLAYLRKRGRDRHCFDAETLDRLAHTVKERAGRFEHIRDALQDCIAGLSPVQRELLNRRYYLEQSLRTISDQTGRPAGSIAQTLYRVRAVLLRCIDRRAARGEAS